MNKTFKKIISLITTFSMCAAMTGVIKVSADGEESTPPVATKRPLTVEYMGMAAAPEATGKKSASLGKEDMSSATTDKPFWIGLAVEKVHDMALFTQGVYSLEVAFEYDPAFIRPIVGNADPDTQWHDEIVAANVGADKDWDEKYEVISVTETDLETDGDRADKGSLSSRSTWKMCTVCITLDEENSTDLRFKGLDTEADAAGKKYLLKLPFRLVGVPEGGATDSNPTVLSLVRGPTTFNIGSDSTGQIPIAKWNETQNQGEADNLQTYFTYPNDIKLFGAGVSISKVEAFRMEPELDDDGNPKKDSEDKEITVEKSYALSQDSTLQGEGFEPTLQSPDAHYLSISNLPDNLQLRITSDDMPTVKVNNTAVTVKLNDGKYVTDPFSLNELDKDVNGGFNNTITITDSGGTEYIIYVRRLLQPRIELMPGNSPYGMIERMSTKYGGTWTDNRIKRAKEKFIDSTNEDPAQQYRFKDVKESVDGVEVSLKPDDVDTNIIYWPAAWSEDEFSGIKPNDSTNMDLRESAVFMYQGEDFADPGFILYNALGQPIDTSKVTVTKKVKMDKMDDKDSEYMKTATQNEFSDAAGVKDGNKISDLSTLYIKPGVYQMSYTFTDPITHEVSTPEETRPIVMLWELGDVNMSASFNPEDTSYITQRIKKFTDPLNLVQNGNATDTKIVKGQTRGLYTYRILDINNSGSVNPEDTSTMKQVIKKFIEKIKFYKPVKVY